MNQQEAMKVIAREKHPLIYAMNAVDLRVIVYQTSGDLFITPGVESSEDDWRIIYGANYVHEIFNQFRRDKGSSQLIYTDVEGKDHIYNYGCEEPIPFNLLMQERWRLHGSPEASKRFIPEVYRSVF